MQKIINGIAIFSGAVALGIVGLGGYVFIRKDAIIEDVKSKIMESVLPGGLGTGAIQGLTGGGLGLGEKGLDMPSVGLPAPDAPDEAAPQSPNLPLGF